MLLRREFGDILLQACNKLEARVSAKDFRTFAKGFFSPANFIKNTANVREIFDAITEHKQWNYRNHYSLEEVLHNFKIAIEKLQEYNQSLSHFNVTTKIKDWIEKNNLDKKHSHDLPGTQSSHDCSKLSLKLKPHMVTEKTLQYVQDLWKDIAKRLLELPNLDAVLAHIQVGCVFITWLIPTDLNVSRRIRDRVSTNEDFFSKWEIVFIMVNDKCIYPGQNIPLPVELPSLYLFGRRIRRPRSVFSIFRRGTRSLRERETPQILEARSSPIISQYHEEEHISIEVSLIINNVYYIY